MSVYNSNVNRIRDFVKYSKYILYSATMTLRKVLYNDNDHNDNGEP